MDLENHAADKVKRALNDVIQLTDDLGERMRIALMASSVCIGAAGAYLAHNAKLSSGLNISEKAATLQLLEILRTNFAEGTDALMAKLAAKRL